MATTELSAPAPRLRLGQRLALGVEIARAYLAIRALSSRRALPDVVVALRDAPALSGLPLPDPRVDGVRLGRAVMRALVLTPGGTKCLVRSLVLLRLLARRGIVDGALIIAVQPGPAVLDAHAWVELAGQPLLPPGDGHERLLAL
ncbi:MAG TPA: lasso peptide biosynthesis B2 protein [Solirubrobacteraceae bacterium]|nr:lasso peptide biosynthesis B2 protein [Solirubrobacteraceae bacterium]